MNAAAPVTLSKSELRDERAHALLDAAAAEFNLYGIAGASLARIARAVGLTRAALYYYYESREELAFRCYLRACGRMADDLAAAEVAARTGLDKVQHFITATLDPLRPAAVVLSEVAALGEERRGEIEAELGRNAARLRRLIDGGIEDRSVRACDAEVVAQAIVGMLAWVPLTEEWVAGSGEEVRRNAARAVVDLVTNGVARDPVYPFHCPLDIAAFAFRPGNAFDREAVAAAKIELLAQAASRLFNRRGIDGTSLDQVTESLGATKGAFYQYLPDKAALVVACHERQLRLSGEIVEAVERAGRNGLERSMFGLHLFVQAFASDLAPLSPLTGVEALRAKARAAIRRRGRSLAERFERFGREGVQDRSCRPYDIRTLSTTGAGVFSWIPKWRRDDDPRTPRVLADEVVALFIRGIRRRA